MQRNSCLNQTSENFVFPNSQRNLNQSVNYGNTSTKQPNVRNDSGFYDSNQIMTHHIPTHSQTMYNGFYNQGYQQNISTVPPKFQQGNQLIGQPVQN